MIYTLTLNPAIDYVMEVDQIRWGGTNRARRAAAWPGGKGINVSTVLTRLGMETVALGFVAGATGEALAAAVAAQGVTADLLRLPRGETRVNVKLRGREETELNAPGPHVAPEDIGRLYGQLERLARGDTLVLAGSVPSSLSPGVYGEILAHLTGRGVRAVVDAEGELLAQALPCRPFLVKPNRAELEALWGGPLEREADLVRAAEALRARGAENVLVSLGPEGALLVDQAGAVRRRRAAPGRAVNTVGAGDSMVAGFLAGADRGWETALALGVAAGCATAFSPGLAQREDILALYHALPPEG